MVSTVALQQQGPGFDSCLGQGFSVVYLQVKNMHVRSVPWLRTGVSPLARTVAVAAHCILILRMDRPNLTIHCTVYNCVCDHIFGDTN